MIDKNKITINLHNREYYPSYWNPQNRNE